MGHDADAPSPAISFAKKKRANRSAKLKQCKLDARREQWLSQVKEKGSKPAAPTAAREGPGPGLRDSDADSSPSPSPSPAPSGKPPGRRAGPGTSSGSSVGSCSRSVSDAEEDGEKGGGGGLDDWEAVADALSAVPPAAPVVIPAAPIPIPDPVRAAPRAWRPDDVFRPQSLPNLAKQRSFPVSLERRYGEAGPSSCPICYEDLDPTDSSFLPCSCGFHLCLFCHKRILEADGRCPGCRKQYAPLPGGGGVVLPLSYQLSRSCSMRSRV